VTRTRGRVRSERGYTLVELMVAVMVMTITLGGIAISLATTVSVTRSNRESSKALDAAHGLVEALGAAEFAEIVPRYNAINGDDPALGASPGNGFSVAGLKARPEDADGMVGAVVFPGDGVELREDFVDPELGMPRDLNGDGNIDGLDHTADYVILPFRVRVEWRGPAGNQRVELISCRAVR
jgi:prepilin-type N-terminal cleavage/methylation domain-containing protein